MKIRIYWRRVVWAFADYLVHGELTKTREARNMAQERMMISNMALRAVILAAENDIDTPQQVIENIDNIAHAAIYKKLENTYGR